MKRLKPIKVVSEGALKVEIRRYSDGRFGFDYKPPGENRKQCRAITLADAEARAEEYVGKVKAGKVHRTDIDDDDYLEFLRWRKLRQRSKAVPELVKAYLTSKEGKGRSEHHLRRIKSDLEKFARAYPKAIDLIHREHVEKWLNSQKVGSRRWNNLRESLVSLWRFARREGAIDANLQGAELVEKKTWQPKVEVYTPEQLKRLLVVAEKEWLPGLVLGAFCGLRPQEISPEPRSKKPGLTWGNILWEKGKVDVPAQISKTRKRRFAPLTEAAKAWLEPLKKDAKETVCPVGQLSKRTYKWARQAKVRWLNDGLRHSFGSYRLALINDLAALALEMGNSPSVIFKHYLNLQHKDTAEEWFGIRPEVTKVPENGDPERA